ncbi:polar amino acid transport system permease protein [Pseudarthrobacter oxydans]|uniref:Polar amino acid transport system permease protein n=1 Tax=Pseudarthrobacter oxydans TaxID=1671 RepID=A0AAW8NDN8_PSEOX|nr:amino acid ABC transporter permease [Pseudarthrobacter oxydans]MDR7165703.1 polar amino acid transport system permease protein [Pseudarthrobacter oxydans]
MSSTPILSGAAEDLNGNDDVTALPLRHPWRWVAATLILLIVAWFAYIIVTNPNLDFATVGEFVFDPRIISGIGLTLLITVVSMVVSTVLAVIIASMRLSENPVFYSLAWFYTWAFRGTPILVQIVFWGYMGLLFQNLTLGIPLTDVVFWQVNTNSLITPLMAGIIALTLNQAAYSSEIVRAGMLSIDEGQREAAFSLGMSPVYTLRRVVLPQAMRVIIPPMGNELISMLKNTSLLSVIAVLELYTQAMIISSSNLKQVELLIVVSLWYLAMTSILSIPQYYLERHFGRGATRNQRVTPLGKLRARFSKKEYPQPAPQTEVVEIP